MFCWTRAIVWVKFGEIPKNSAFLRTSLIWKPWSRRPYHYEIKSCVIPWFFKKALSWYKLVPLIPPKQNDLRIHIGALMNRSGTELSHSFSRHSDVFCSISIVGKWISMWFHSNLELQCSLWWGLGTDSYVSCNLTLSALIFIDQTTYCLAGICPVLSTFPHWDPAL